MRRRILPLFAALAVLFAAWIARGPEVAPVFEGTPRTAATEANQSEAEPVAVRRGRLAPRIKQQCRDHLHPRVGELRQPRDADRIAAL